MNLKSLFGLNAVIGRLQKYSHAGASARLIYLGIDKKFSMVALSFLPHEDRMQVLVRDNNVDQALRILKKKLQREGIFREMRLREAFEKPSIEKAEAVSRQRKLARKQMQREGLLPSKPKKAR